MEVFLGDSASQEFRRRSAPRTDGLWVVTQTLSSCWESISSQLRRWLWWIFEHTEVNGEPPIIFSAKLSSVMACR